MAKSEAPSGFNYATRIYRQAPAHPGIWDYAGDCGLFRAVYGQSGQRLQRYGQTVRDLGINPAQSRQSRNSA